MNESIVLTSYGNQFQKAGIVFLDPDSGKISLQIPLPGKCNCVIEDGNRLYAPVQTDQPYMFEFEKTKDGCTLLGKYPTKLFYSHGFKQKDRLLLASFSEGADAVYDLNTHQETAILTHQRAGRKTSGRSHYVASTPDGRHFFSVDNGLQQIYVFDADQDGFQVVSVRDFGDENIRLMPYSSYSGCAYLNTEITNRIYIMDFHDVRPHIVDVENMEYQPGSFSGGCAVSEDGRKLCVSLRNENILNLYKIRKDGRLTLLDSVSCGDMPRDILFQNGKMYVSCTNADAVEVYTVDNDKLLKTGDIPVAQPVTFRC